MYSKCNDIGRDALLKRYSEYKKLKFELSTSIEAILDQYTLELLERGVL